MEPRRQVEETSKEEQTLSRDECYEVLVLLDSIEEAVDKLRSKELGRFGISQEECQQLRSSLQTLQDKVLKKIREEKHRWMEEAIEEKAAREKRPEKKVEAPEESQRKRTKMKILFKELYDVRVYA